MIGLNVGNLDRASRMIVGIVLLALAGGESVAVGRGT